MTETQFSPEMQGGPRPVLGALSFVVGAATLLLVLVHFWSGPFAPQADVSVSIGEIAADIRQSALRALAGEAQPAPEALPWDFDRVLKAIAGGLAGLSVILAAGAVLRHESRRPAIAGAILGGGAILFQLFTWAILMIAGALILTAIVGNIPGILGE